MEQILNRGSVERKREREEDMTRRARAILLSLKNLLVLINTKLRNHIATCTNKYSYRAQ